VGGGKHEKYWKKSSMERLLTKDQKYGIINYKVKEISSKGENYMKMIERDFVEIRRDSRYGVPHMVFRKDFQEVRVERIMRVLTDEGIIDIADFEISNKPLAASIYTPEDRFLRLSLYPRRELKGTVLYCIEKANFRVLDYFSLVEITLFHELGHSLDPNIHQRGDKRFQHIKERKENLSQIRTLADGTSFEVYQSEMEIEDRTWLGRAKYRNLNDFYSFEFSERIANENAILLMKWFVENGR